MDRNTRRDRRNAREPVRPGPKKRDPQRRPAWQTALVGLALVAGAFAVAFVLISDESGPELTETAPVDIAGEALGPIPDDPAQDPARGQPAPQATGINFQDEPVDLLADDGGTIVVFLAHWCPHCQREVPRIVDHLGQDLPDDVRLVGVVTATDRSQGNYPPSDWLEREDWPFDVVVDSEDGQLAQAYGLQSYPTFVVVGDDGAVRTRGSGELSTEALDALVEAARS